MRLASTAVLPAVAVTLAPVVASRVRCGTGRGATTASGRHAGQALQGDGRDDLASGRSCGVGPACDEGRTRT